MGIQGGYSYWGWESGGVAVAGLTLVETQDGDGSAFTPTATTIPSGYREIVITGLVHSTSASDDNLSVVINGDSSDASYRAGRILQNGTTLRGYGYDSINPSRFTGVRSLVAGTAEEQWGALDMKAPQYSNTDAYKWLSARSAWWNDTPSMVYQESIFLTWENTSAITSIQFAWDSASTMSAGSSFSVWVR